MGEEGEGQKVEGGGLGVLRKSMRVKRGRRGRGSGEDRLS